jgi:hypothetical protein
MNTRPIRSFLSLSLALCVGACVDVGVDPGPIVNDVQEPTIEVCLEDQQQTYRCRENHEEVQICKEDTVGEFVWDTIDFCDEGQGCFEIPLNNYPTCISKFDCFTMVYNLISCDSASQLKASQRQECRVGVERLAIDSSYKDVYDCYYREGCDSTDKLDPTQCVLDNCATLLTECVHPSQESPPDFEMSVQPDSDDESRNPLGPGTQDASLSAESDSAAESDPSLPELGEIPAECPIDFITCVAGCVPDCMQTCESSEEGPIDSYTQGTCQQACPTECARECEEEDDTMELLDMFTTGKCVADCSKIQGFGLQACLFQKCPDQITPCLQAGSYDEGSCNDSFVCLLNAVSGHGIDATLACTSQANTGVLAQAIDVLTCVAQETSPAASCEWVQGYGTWFDHVLTESKCLANACSTSVDLCETSILSE